MSQQVIQRLRRRGKYLIADTQEGSMIIHLGMSGSLRVLPLNTVADKHDHVDWVLNHKKLLRYRDPRRFGIILWTQQDPLQHRLLRDLGVEPLGKDLTAEYMRGRARQRQGIAIKNFIMDSRVVVGVGNIYASEALFGAGIHPNIPARRLSLQRWEKLVASIQRVLKAALKKGGTTLRDFVQADGKPGYFSLELQVYGRSGLPCVRCKQPVKRRVIGQRSSFFCPACQR